MAADAAAPAVRPELEETGEPRPKRSRLWRDPPPVSPLVPGDSSSSQLPTLDLAGDLGEKLVAAVVAVFEGRDYTAPGTEEAACASGGAFDRLKLSPALTAAIAAARREVLEGGGCCLLRSFGGSRGPEALQKDHPLRRLTLLALSVALGGRPAKQSADLQELVGDVQKRPAEQGEEKHFRGYRNSGAQRAHTDSNRPGLFGKSKCDILMIHCVRASDKGGESRLLRAAALHEALSREKPEIYARLRESRWPWSAEREWLSEWGDREDLKGLPILMGPDESGVEKGLPATAFQVQYGKILRMNVEAGLRKRAEAEGGDVAAADLEASAEAMDTLEALIDREGMALLQRLEPGDLVLLNNFAWMHGRESFLEEEADGTRRHMMRVWVCMDA